MIQIKLTPLVLAFIGMGLSSLCFANSDPSGIINIDMMVSAHSPAQPIKSFLDDWDKPLDSGDLAYAQGRVDIHVKPKINSAISYGLSWRYDYLMQFSEETAKGYWQYKNNQPSTSSQRYPLYLEASNNERLGANIGFTHQLNPKWQLTTQANIWQGLHVLEGDITGELITQDRVLKENESIRDSIDITQASVDYYYDKPVLGEENLDWNPSKPEGYGYSLDLKLAGDLTHKTQLSIRAYDVLGRMHWQDAPSTQYRLDYDVKGRPLYALEGQLDNNDVKQTLPWRIESSLTHQLNDKWQLGVHGQNNDVQNLYQLSAQYYFNNTKSNSSKLNSVKSPLSVTGIIEPQTKAIGFALDSQYGGIKLLTDDLDPDEAKRSEISVYGRYIW